MAFEFDHAAEDFNRAIEQFGGDDGGDAAEQDAPVFELDAQDRGGGDHNGGDEEVNEEAGVAAHAELQAAKCVGKFPAPRVASAISAI